MTAHPEPRQIDSWRAAEENAAVWMRFWGYPDARVTQGGPDGGVDVMSSLALAQVKFEAVQTGTPALQRLVGARRNDHHKALFFFSGAGFSTPAIDYADHMDIALFKYDLVGRMTPSNSVALRLLGQDPNATQVGPGLPYVIYKPGAAGPPKPTREPTEVKPGHGWLTRNISLLAGVFFLQQGVGNLKAYLQGTAPAYIDWYDPVISLAVGLALIGLWWRLRHRRREWARLRNEYEASQRSRGGPYSEP